MDYQNQSSPCFPPMDYQNPEFFNGRFPEGSASCPDFFGNNVGFTVEWNNAEQALPRDIVPMQGNYLHNSDPFLPENRIPLPVFEVPADVVWEDDQMVSESLYGRRRNERERQRVRCINDAFERLRSILPQFQSLVNGGVPNLHRRCSKVDILKGAIDYIRHLEDILKETEDL